MNKSIDKNVYEAVQCAPPSEEIYTQKYPWDSDDLKYSLHIMRRTSNTFDQRFLHRSVQGPTEKASREHGGGSIPSTTFRRSAGLWRIDEIYFITIDAYVNCPEHFLTSPSSTSTEGQESSQ